MKSFGRFSFMQKPLPFLLITSLLLYAGYWTYYYIGYFGDDAAFLSNALSILRGSYRSLYLTGYSWDDHYPPGFPLALSPFLLLFPPTSIYLKLFPMVLTALSILLAYRLLQNWLKDEMLLLAVALYAYNPVTASYSTSLMSEPFFTFLTLSSFFMMNRVLQAESAKRILGLGLLVAWAMLTRPIGMLVGVGVVAGLLMARRYKAALQSMGLAFTLWGAFVILNMKMTGRASDYFDYSLAALTSPDYIPRLFNSVQQNYLNIVIAHLFHGEHWINQTGPFLTFLILLIWVAVSTKGFHACWTRVAPKRALLAGITTYTLLYLCVHGLWPVFQDRYVLPILPYLFLFLVGGLQFIFTRYLNDRASVLLCSALLLPGLLYINYSCIRQAWSADRPAYSLPPTETMRWIESQTNPEALFCVPQPSAFFLFTRRAGLGHPVAYRASVFQQRLESASVRYVMLANHPLAFLAGSSLGNEQANENRFAQWITSTPQRFLLLYENPREGTRIYEMRRQN